MGEGAGRVHSNIDNPFLIKRFQILPESLACRLYVAVVLVQTTIDLAIEGELFLRVQRLSEQSDSNDTTKRMPVYLSIFALAQYVHVSPPHG